MTGTYNGWLVLLSVMVAITSSYVSLDMSSRVTAASGHKTWYWLGGGSMSMGLGIWSMHFIGMLAFRLQVPLNYDVAITLLSLLIAIAASAFSLRTASRDTLRGRRLVSAGSLIGFGIAAMHYTGMAALKMQPPIRYQPLLVALSLVIAVAASTGALWSAFKLRLETLFSAFWKKAGSAVLMGTAIYGMHYTGMVAANFAPGSISTAGPQNIDNTWLAVAVGGFTLLFLLATLLISAFDAYLAGASTKHAGELRALSADLQRRATELGEANAQLEREMRVRVQAENELRQAHDELDDRVAARTAELARANQSLRDQITRREATEQALRQALEEREALARNLHDNIVQAIYAVGMRLEDIQRLTPNNPRQAAVQLENAVADLNSVIRDVRRYISGRSGRPLSGTQLRDELVKLVQGVDSIETPHFELSVDAAAAELLSPDEANHILYIAREALSNSLKHSRSRRGTITLRFAEEGVRVEVSDDGVGFDPRVRRGDGLQNMAARADHIGARLEIHSSPGQGTRIVVQITKERGSNGRS